MMIKLVRNILQKLQKLLGRNVKGSPAANRPWLSSYEPGVPKDITIPDHSLIHYLITAAEGSPELVFINYFGKKITYAQFYRCVQECAAGLRQQGVNKGDKVALILPNVPQLMIAYWAIHYIGAVAVLVNPLLSRREIKNQLGQVKPKVVIILDLLLKRFENASELRTNKIYVAMVDSFFPTVKRIAYQFSAQAGWRNKAGGDFETCRPFRQLLSKSKLLEPEPGGADDVAVMLFTGGVTGTPKATMLSHRNLVANTLQGMAWMAKLHPFKEVIMGALPFVHSYGMTACHHLAVFTQSTILLQPRFNVRKVMRDMRNLGVTIFAGVPTMFQAMLDHSRTEKALGDSLKLCISGGAPLPEKLHQAFRKKFGVAIAQGYGLTEASPITHCNPIGGKQKARSIGLPWPGTTAEIRDPETGQVLPSGKAGELWVKGPQIMQGYFQRPEETADVLSKGWLATGDIAVCDDEGYFFIIDRKKDVILSGGQNIYPAEVEMVLQRHPAIKEISIVGAPDEYLGEVVKAAIVKNENAQLDLKDIQTFCADKLAWYKIPRHIEFYDELPKNFLGKVLKREL